MVPSADLGRAPSFGFDIAMAILCVDPTARYGGLMSTIYIVQAFTRRGKKLIAAKPVRAVDETEAKRRAERASVMTSNVGAIAMVQEIEDDSEVSADPVILARFGDTPQDD